MIRFSSKSRSKQLEIMDDFSLKGDKMKELLTDLKNVNKRLGGNTITTSALSKLLAGHSKKEMITLIDIGCGDGEMLRECARFGKRNGFNFRLLGLDANAFIVEEAKIRSKDFHNISFQQIDIFSIEIKELDFDIALCTLFLHHFTNNQITDLLNLLITRAKVGIVINDLHRNWLAFSLFMIFGQFFLKTKIARHDGLISIASGFLRKELEDISNKINYSESIIKWKWAFRYQWIIKKGVKY